MHLHTLLLSKVCITTDGHLPDFHQVVRFVARMQKEPDFLYKVVYAGFSSGASDVHHPLVGRLIIFFTLIRGNIPECK